MPHWRCGEPCLEEPDLEKSHVPTGEGDSVRIYRMYGLAWRLNAWRAGVPAEPCDQSRPDGLSAG